MVGGGDSQRVAVAWSSGKDCAWALCELLQREDVEVAALLTTVREEDGAVAIHECSREVLHAQAALCGLPLYEVELPWPCPNAEYEKRMRDAAYLLLANEITGLAFGDLHLADIRRYREALFADTGLELLFPLWQRDTARLARQMTAGGLQSRICCVQRGVLPADLLGRPFDAEFLDSLPKGVDPCGENGEFHTIVTACPAMQDRLELKAAGLHEDEHHQWLEYGLES